MAPLASPDDLRLWLGGLSAEQLSDERATLILEGVSDEVLEYTNRVELGFELKPADADHAVRVNGTGTKVILLPDPPVTDVVKVVEDPDGDALELVAGVDYEWDEDGVLTRLAEHWPSAGGYWRRRARFYEITYARGRAVGTNVRNLVLRVSARAVANPEGLTQEGEAGYTNSYGFDATRLPSLSDADKLVLHPYRL